MRGRINLTRTILVGLLFACMAACEDPTSPRVDCFVGGTIAFPAACAEIASDFDCRSFEATPTGGCIFSECRSCS